MDKKLLAKRDVCHAFFCVKRGVEQRELYDLCEMLMKKHKVLDHGFKIFLSKRIKTYYACCNGDGDQRSISLSINMLSKKSKNFCTQVILHEIAHALDFIRNGYEWRYRTTKTGKKICLVHDDKWREICREIGAPTSTCL